MAVTYHLVFSELVLFYLYVVCDLVKCLKIGELWIENFRFSAFYCAKEWEMSDNWLTPYHNAQEQYHRLRVKMAAIKWRRILARWWQLQWYSATKLGIELCLPRSLSFVPSRLISFSNKKHNHRTSRLQAGVSEWVELVEMPLLLS